MGRWVKSVWFHAQGWPWRGSLQVNQMAGFAFAALCILLCSFRVVSAQAASETLRVMMGEGRFQAAGLNKLQEEELQQLQAYILSVFQVGKQTAQNQLMPNAAERSVGTSIEDLEGGKVIADDGTFLGIISKNSFESKSLSNQFGLYGNKFSAKSIFNQFGIYGGQFSSQSPFNRFTTSPPRVFDRLGNFVGFLSINNFLSPRINPHALVAWLERE